MPEAERAAKIILWRAYVPRWAYDPLSGEGAARFGGRWNPVGERCIYAAREPSTAWAEYNQGLVQHPALIAQLVLANARLADLTQDAELARERDDTGILTVQWRADLDAGKMPATHTLALRLKASSYDGVIYPSFMSRGGSCVALWRWNGEGEPRLTAVDPEGRLPKGPASWM